MHLMNIMLFKKLITLLGLDQTVIVLNFCFSECRAHSLHKVMVVSSD